MLIIITAVDFDASSDVVSEGNFSLLANEEIHVDDKKRDAGHKCWQKNTKHISYSHKELTTQTF